MCFFVSEIKGGEQKMMGVILNERQQLFAEEHHEVTLSFLRDRNLSRHKFYDAIANGFLVAVKLYDESVEKGEPFKDFSVRYMQASLYKNTVFPKEKDTLTYIHPYMSLAGISAFWEVM